MKQIGFEFGSIEVEVSGVAFDLHNCFDFCSLSYNVEDQCIDMSWKKNEYSSENDPSEVLLHFHKISHFSAESRDKDMPFTEDRCVESISFVGDSEPTEECFCTDSPSEDLHLVMAFQSGFILRIYSETVECSVNT